jgi:murein DD-endopeptidase MepM/ murein hydrolase activator NlpD
MRARVKPVAPPPAEPSERVAPARRRRWIWWLGGSAVGATCVIVSTAIYAHDEEPVQPPPPQISVAPQPVPVAPPIDPRVEEDHALLEEIRKDTWIHPLAGPSRRMPVNHNGAFGASRPGERPPECVSGHCGVDIGQVWGEPVHAVHDGVVEWVNRGPNEERGGVFVKLAHRDGSLYSWYFHLAAGPRRIQPGAKIAAGDVIGLLGDTGVKQSGPHLHFSLSVKTSKTHERYMDPEPLIAIWPLWIRDSEGSGHPSSASEPGVPVRQVPSRPKRAKPQPVAAPAAEPVQAAEPAPEAPPPATE